MLQQIQGMPPDERKRTLETARADCICGDCPTYDPCMAGGQELLFCLTRKSACTVAKKACLCPTCPVTPRMGLSHGYYCARGSEKEIRKIV
ncbi:MAG: DUF2769 domain-containing protein [Methanomicrobiales archaeon]|nr:DUF2769 domain-containing protein [Methanomicrobiales archaeon]